LAASILVGGCQHIVPGTPNVPTTEAPIGSGIKDQRVDGPIATTEPERPGAVVNEGRSATGPSATGGQSGVTPSGDAVDLDFADTDVRAVVQQILGQVLKVDFAIDPAVHGTVTYKSAHPVPTRMLLSTLETLLAQNNAALVKVGAVYRVLPATATGNTPTIGGEATSGTDVLTLRYTSAPELVRTLTPILGQGGAHIVPDPARNAILVSGDSAARTTIERLIRAFDINMLSGQTYALFPINSLTDPHKVAADLQHLLKTEGEGSLAGVVRVVPMEEANAVLVVAPQRQYIDEAQRFFEMVDKAKSQETRTWHVYYVQNGQAEDLVGVLRQAFVPGASNASESAGGTGGGSSVGSTAPGLPTAHLNSGTNQGTGTGSSTTGGLGGGGSSGGLGGSSSGGLGGSGASATGGLGASGSQPASAVGAYPTTSALSTDTGGGDAGAGSNQLRIITNKSNNAILYYATTDEQSSIEAMLRKIDIQPLQVRIDATIAEVTLTDQLQYGTQFYLNYGGINGLLGAAANSTQPNGPNQFVISNLGGRVGAVISALASVTKVRVLSSPQIMVLDNETARLLVGDLVPYLSQSSQSTISPGAPVINSVDYRETGVILDVVPRVGNGGQVTLELSQEVSAVEPAASVGGIQSPTFSDRLVHSRVVIQDGQTIGLAGLISDTASEVNGGIPLLKDIPVLGALFGTQNNNRNRTELLVLITPHIIDDQRRARALTDDLRANLAEPSQIQDQLKNLPHPGSSNPNAFLAP
jgi:general secretion pathway protein D